MTQFSLSVVVRAIDFVDESKAKWVQTDEGLVANRCDDLYAIWMAGMRGSLSICCLSQAQPLSVTVVKCDNLVQLFYSH